MRTYTIQHGDSISKIAEEFKFDDYQPIWRFNTLVKKKLTSGDPNKISSGTVIVIPKTKQQYDDVIAKLEKLRLTVVEDSKEITSDLDSAKKEVDRFGEKLDLVADLAMIGKGAVKATVKIGSKRLRSYALKKKMLEATQKVLVAATVDTKSTEGIVIDKSTGAAIDNSIMLMAKKNFNAAKAKDQFTKGTSKALAKKGAVFIAKAVAPVEEANGMAEVVATVADFLIGGLDAVKPTNVAKLWIYATTGEHPDDAYEKAKKHAAAQRDRSLRKLNETLMRIRQERKTVYPPA